MYLGSSQLNNVYVGDAQVNRIYKGSEELWNAGTPWTLVMIPDTQNIFSESCIVNNSNPDGEEIFRQMGAYIAAQKTTRNIKQVMHVGDIIAGGGSSSQFNRAKAGRDEIITSGIPYTYAPGNHDYAGHALSNGRDLSGFNAFFPQSSISSQPWYGGHYQANKSENIYTIQIIEGQKWMFLSVEFYPRTAVQDWMNSVIASENPDFTVVATHSYLDRGERDLPTEDFWDGIIIATGSQYGPQVYGSDYSNDAVSLYNNVISQNESIVLVISGHILDGRHDEAEPNYPGTNNGVVAHSGKQFTHNNGNVCTQIVYNHQNDGIPPCNDNRSGTTPALHFFELNPATRTITTQGYDPVFDVDIATLGNYPTSRPDWAGRHSVTFNY